MVRRFSSLLLGDFRWSSQRALRVANIRCGVPQGEMVHVNCHHSLLHIAEACVYGASPPALRRSCHGSTGGEICATFVDLFSELLWVVHAHKGDIRCDFGRVSCVLP